METLLYNKCAYVLLHSVKVRYFIAQSSHIRALFTPPYSPAMNSIEKLWALFKGQLRRYLLKHREGDLTVEDIESTIRGIFDSMDQRMIKNLSLSNSNAIDSCYEGFLDCFKTYVYNT
jgi:hypothetical protein